MRRRRGGAPGVLAALIFVSVAATAALGACGPRAAPTAPSSPEPEAQPAPVELAWPDAAPPAR